MLVLWYKIYDIQLGPWGILNSSCSYKIRKEIINLNTSSSPYIIIIQKCLLKINIASRKTILYKHIWSCYVYGVKTTRISQIPVNTIKRTIRVFQLICFFLITSEPRYVTDLTDLKMWTISNPQTGTTKSF